ncbi:MAG TPA: carboxypeptidase-like regulatory domain-containing protein [Thermoanaerobaculia bacterium]|nr:carboxypeptidase-like regulatory domain-containing protein [Thermoanaerobaculia bacterium]
MKRFLAAAFVLLATLSAHASRVTTALTGHVMSDAKAVAGATITVTSSSLMHPRTTTTNANGAYWIEDLPPGTYDITFAHAGMTTLTRRTIVEIARVARVDATLEANAEEESVTSTSTTISVADTQPVTTHISDAELDRLPRWRTTIDSALAIAGAYYGFTGTLLDDAEASMPYLLGQEALEEVTVVRGAAPVEIEYFGALVAKTRSGGDAFHFSVRDTLTSISWIAGRPELDEGARHPFGGGVDHFVEGAIGGPVVRQRLWFFASAWRGGQDDRPFHNVRGVAFNLNAQLDDAQSLAASYSDGGIGVRVGVMRAGSEGSLRYTNIVTPFTTVEANVARSTTTFTPSIFGNGPTYLFVDDSLFVKASHLTSKDSVVSAGVRAQKTDAGGSTTLFANDRWSHSNLILNLGGRLERGGHELHFRPRVSATWDMRGDGRRSLFAAVGSYADPRNPPYAAHEVLAGFATAIGVSGTFRADLAHRYFERLDEPGTRSTILHVETAYRLFDRFVAGAFYEYAHQDERAFPPAAHHAANGWLSADFPLASHVLGVTLLQHLDDYGFGGPEYGTDVALRYTIPIRTLALTVAADVGNVFNDERGRAFVGGRTFRGWVRVRL